MNFEPTEEQKLLRRAVREFAEKEVRPYGRLYDEKGEYPWDILRKAAKLGFVAADLPEEYGGSNLDYLSCTIIIEELCRADSGIGSAIMAASLGCPMVKHFGTENQKERYLPRIVRGEAVSAIAITEPECGSDVAAINTRAERTQGGWLLNGTKTFITNGSIADWVVILAKTDPSAGHRGISAFIVETRWEGYEARRIKKMGLNCHDTAEIFLKSVFVPEENLIGYENAGFYQVMYFFNESRVAVAAAQLGMAIGAYERALEYAKQRKAFGKPIIEHQAIAFKLADMFINIEAARHLVYKAAWLISKGRPDPALSSAAKLFASEVAINVTYEAVQIFGGYGYSKDYDVERYYRDARVGTIYEGTSEIQRLIIGRVLAGKIGF
ncbi:MAG: acyl-CoA dehydrogenase family protein [Candidatus Nezhaarchaeota archaeon]|nr:acyl-CoA dehydrogenase family protein [Candidatus Nezhaarchaeota archaeon]MCX8141656.1 acyl-CoA dehydrogenase family protein [Candidatus Nezhaarchaeota archaeon]MDW8049923.1 acyl-CoA dehydrogenase family protein [Nitrososphaerota archaeon]